MMVVLSSPSGAGKTTLTKKIRETDASIRTSISYTTRPRRPAEANGVDYYFVEKEEFEEMISSEKFVEYASVFGNFYGTPKKQVEQNLEQGTDLLFDIDWQGTRQLKSFSNKDIVSIFILPPSIAELGKRLRNRNQDSEEVLLSRMKKSTQEISHWDEYDYVIINQDVEESLQQIQGIITAERLKRNRNLQLQSFVDNLLAEG